MSKVTVTEQINATPDAVWAVIGNPLTIASWHPAIATSVASEGGRTCTLADGGEVVENILAHDDGARHYSYSIVTSPLPMTDYTASIAVAERDGGAEVTWQSEFTPQGIEPAELEGMIHGLFEAGLQAVRDNL